jgi:hypothetical protein
MFNKFVSQSLLNKVNEWENRIINRCLVGSKGFKYKRNNTK